MSSINIDMSGLDQLKRALEGANGSNLQVGWFDSANYDAGTPVAGVAALQEFGSKTAPPRPFFRPAISDNKGKWSNIAESGARAMVEGRASIHDVLDRIGLAVQADVKNKISGEHLALSPVTLALRKLRDDGVKINKSVVGSVAAAVAKGETGAGQLGEPSANADPLRDTGIMLASLTYEIS